MNATTKKPVALYTSLSDESTGECPCGCGRTAYPYATPALADANGYIDAAPACALTLLIREGYLTQEQVDAHRAELIAYRAAAAQGTLS
jgi:hypothetical protein